MNLVMSRPASQRLLFQKLACGNRNLARPGERLEEQALSEEKWKKIDFDREHVRADFFSANGVGSRVSFRGYRSS